MELIAKTVLFKKNKIKTHFWYIIFQITGLQVPDFYKLKLFCKGRDDECSCFKYDENQEKKIETGFLTLKYSFTFGS